MRHYFRPTLIKADSNLAQNNKMHATKIRLKETKTKSFQCDGYMEFWVCVCVLAERQFDWLASNAQRATIEKYAVNFDVPGKYQTRKLHQMKYRQFCMQSSV